MLRFPATTLLVLLVAAMPACRAGAGLLPEGLCRGAGDRVSADHGERLDATCRRGVVSIRGVCQAGGMGSADGQHRRARRHARPDGVGRHRLERPVHQAPGPGRQAPRRHAHARPAHPPGRQAVRAVGQDRHPEPYGPLRAARLPDRRRQRVPRRDRGALHGRTSVRHPRSRRGPLHAKPDAPARSALGGTDGRTGEPDARRRRSRIP